MRTFLALCFPVGTTRRIAEAMEQKAGPMRDAGWKLAWVPPANLHVTLKFFGSIPPESVEAIAMRLRQRLVDLPPVALRAKGHGAFPGGSEPARVLWIGVEGKALLPLQQTIEKDMEALGFAKESRVYHPHLTVARVLEPPPPEQAGLWTAGDPVDYGEDLIPEIIVYESRLQNANRAPVEYVAKARVQFTK